MAPSWRQAGPPERPGAKTYGSKVAARSLFLFKKPRCQQESESDYKKVGNGKCQRARAYAAFPTSKKHRNPRFYAAQPAKLGGQGKGRVGI